LTEAGSTGARGDQHGTELASADIVRKHQESVMPKAWTKKEERQYEHIKKSEQKRGKGARAKEVAARTVNKLRRLHGETPNKTTQGTGNPNRSLAQRSRQELYNRARQLDIAGRSKMSKDDLVRAIQHRA
jgi:hypothetical protein